MKNNNLIKHYKKEWINIQRSKINLRMNQRLLHNIRICRYHIYMTEPTTASLPIPNTPHPSATPHNRSHHGPTTKLKE